MLTIRSDHAMKTRYNDTTRLERTCHPIWRFLIFGIQQYVVIDANATVSAVHISHVARVLVEVVTVGARVARLTLAALSAVD